MYDPPAGYDDMLGDSEAVTYTGPYYSIEVDEVGTVKARKPMPNATAALAMSSNSKITAQSRVDYLTMFAQNHLAPGEYERLLYEMMSGTLGTDAIPRVVRAVATWGTARPT